MKLGERLKELRGGLFKTHMSAATGIHVRQLQLWELGYSYPRFEYLMKLANYYGMSLSEMLKGVDEL